LSGAVAKPASINLQKLVLSPTGSLNLGFILREDLLLCSSYLPLGVPNWAVIYTPSSIFDQPPLVNWKKVYSTSNLIAEIDHLADNKTYGTTFARMTSADRKIWLRMWLRKHHSYFTWPMLLLCLLCSPNIHSTS
jgi:hypothetical protein